MHSAGDVSNGATCTKNAEEERHAEAAVADTQLTCMMIQRRTMTGFQIKKAVSQAAVIQYLIVLKCAA